MSIDNFYVLEECSKRLILLIQKRRIDRVCDDEIQFLFLSLWKNFPDFNIRKLEEIYRECDLHLSQPLIELIKRWNILAHPSQRLDLKMLPVVIAYKCQLRQKLDFLKSSVEETAYFKDIFDEQWFQNVNQLIDLYDGDGSFGTDTHTAFIGFIQEVNEGGNLIKRLDEAFGAIAKAIGQQRIRSLRDKMRDVSCPLKDYLGTVYEILILGPWAQKRILVEYEPKIGEKYADGLINIRGTHILIEATVMITGREINSWGMINLNDEADRISRKILYKVDQLKKAQEPILLFLSPHTRILPQEIKMGISNAFQQDESQLICGVILSNYRGNDFKFVRNSNPSVKQLSNEVWQSLIEEYKLQELDLTDSWSEN